MSSVVSGAQSPPIVKSPLPPEIEELHASVVAAGQETYTDPATGYMVMSALYHTYVTNQNERKVKGAMLVGLFGLFLDSLFPSSSRTHATHAP